MDNLSTPQQRWEKNAEELRGMRQSQQQVWGEIDNALIGRLLAGEASNEEILKVKEELKRHPQLGEIIRLVREVLAASGTGEESVDARLLAQPKKQVRMIQCPG